MSIDLFTLAEIGVLYALLVVVVIALAKAARHGDDLLEEARREQMQERAVRAHLGPNRTLVVTPRYRRDRGC